MNVHEAGVHIQNFYRSGEKKKEKRRRRGSDEKEGKRVCESVFLSSTTTFAFLLNSLSSLFMEQKQMLCSAILHYSFSSFLLWDRRCVLGKREISQNISKKKHTGRIILHLRHGDFFLCSISLIEALINFCALFWTTFHSVRAVFTSNFSLYRKCSMDK